MRSRSFEHAGEHYVVLSPESIRVEGGEETQVVDIVIGVGCVLEGTTTDGGGNQDWVAAYDRAQDGTVIGWARVENNQFRFEGLRPGEVWIQRRWEAASDHERVRVELVRGTINQMQF